MRLSTLDLIASVMDRPQRRLDWAIVLHMPEPPALNALTRGEESARREYPSTAAVLRGKTWKPADWTPIQSQDSTASSLEHDIHGFIDRPMDLTSEAPLSQRLFTHAGSAVLVTRVHHAVADLIGATLWLRHQLQVALGAREVQDTARHHPNPRLRTHPDPSGKSSFSYRGASDALKHNGAPPSSMRSWHSVARPRLARATPEFTYNDALTLAAMETFEHWNGTTTARKHRIGIWIPVNIRADPLDGFGNGTTRIRAYNRYPATASAGERASLIRAQVRWSREHGEWAIPPLGPIERLPVAFLAPLLRAYFNRPWVDMGTGPLSHAERTPLDDLPARMISRVELIGTLDRRHAFGIFALTRCGVTHMTFVHDPARLNSGDAARLSQHFLRTLERTGM